MRYLLDTCVISDFVKGELHTLTHIKHANPSEIAISSITLMEIEYGLALNSKRTAKIKSVIHDFINEVTTLTFDYDDAICAAKVRALLKQQGNPIGSYDILLAGTALNHNLIFITSNTKEFIRIQNLKIENWRQPNT